MNLDQLALFCAGGAAGVALTTAAYYSRRVWRNMADLRHKVARLEDAQAKRMPHNVVYASEDALAVALDVDRHIDQLSAELDALKQRREKELRLLRAIRGGGAGYDPDEPAGRR